MRSRSGRRWVALTAFVTGVVVMAPAALLASHTFVDVSDENTFHSDIAWLAEADVTRGCNPPANTEFCPKDFVTREQMAAFMNRLASNRVVQADDADTLGGFTASELAPRASVAHANSLGGPFPRLDLEIEAPTAGILVLNAAVDIFVSGVETTDVQCRLDLDGSPISGTTMGVSVSNVGDMRDGICTTTGGVAVEEGVHTIAFVIEGHGNASVLNAGLNAIWVPFDGTGAIPTP